MDYKAKECAVCGSDKIKLISHKNDGENIFYTYACEACGEVFSTESKFLKQQEKLKKLLFVQMVVLAVSLVFMKGQRSCMLSVMA